MDKTTADLIAGMLQKSAEKLNASRELLSLGFFEDAVSRAYYSAFHAAQALLLTEGQRPTTHKGVVTLFGLLFIKTGRLERRFGRILTNLKDDRETGDYEIFSWLDKDTAQRAVDEAEEFLGEARKYLADQDLPDIK